MPKQGQAPRLRAPLLGGVLSLVAAGAYTSAAVDEGVILDAAERRSVTAAAIKNLRAHYFDPDVARRMADALLAREKDGGYDAVTEGRAFADLLTRQIRDVSHDMHLVVVYSQSRLPARPLERTPEVLARYREELERDNCTFEKVEVLPHNIRYLKLNSFPDPSICRSRATAVEPDVQVKAADALETAKELAERYLRKK